LTDTSIPQRDWPYYKSEYDAGRMSQGAIAKELSITQSAVSKRFKAMDKAAANGSPDSGPGAPNELPTPLETVHPSSPEGSPTAALQPMEYMGEPGSPTGSLDIARQTDLDNLKTRVEILETFIARLHQPSTYLPGSPSGSPGSPTHKRGFVMADDLFQAIHTYATAHHLQVKDVLDLALRRFFAQVGEAVHGA
jgi:hypothetical protein